MKMMMNMQQDKLHHLSSELSQSDDNEQLKTTQDTTIRHSSSSSLSQLEVSSRIEVATHYFVQVPKEIRKHLIKACEYCV